LCGAAWRIARRKGFGFGLDLWLLEWHAEVAQVECSWQLAADGLLSNLPQCPRDSLARGIIQLVGY
jgi:hypothetical protein